MRRGFAIAVMALLVVGCSTSPVSYQNADPAPASRLYAFQEAREGQAQVIVTRDSGMSCAAHSFAFYVDGQHAADLRSGESAVFNVSPGRHMLGAKLALLCGGDVSEDAVSLSAGDSVRYRVSLGGRGDFKLSPTAF